MLLLALVSRISIAWRIPTHSCNVHLVAGILYCRGLYQEKNQQHRYHSVFLSVIQAFWEVWTSLICSWKNVDHACHVNNEDEDFEKTLSRVPVYVMLVSLYCLSLPPGNHGWSRLPSLSLSLSSPYPDPAKNYNEKLPLAWGFQKWI